MGGSARPTSEAEERTCGDLDVIRAALLAEAEARLRYGRADVLAK
jgi:hypothetical protein